MKIGQPPLPDSLTADVASSGFLGAGEGESLRRLPEANLMIAILEDAVGVCVRHLGKPTGRRPADYRKSVDWLLSRDGRWVYSFQNICEVLGLPVDRTRAAILKLLSEARESTRPRPSLRIPPGGRQRVRPRRSRDAARPREPDDVQAGSGRSSRARREASPGSSTTSGRVSIARSTAREREPEKKEKGGSRRTGRRRK